MDIELTVYEGTLFQLTIDVDKWSYFELVDIVNELGYRKIYTIWYKDPTFEMHVLADDKGALDFADLCKVYLSVDIYTQYSMSPLGFYDGPFKEEELNHEDTINFEEKDLLSKLYEEIIRKDCEAPCDNVQDGKG